MNKKHTVHGAAPGNKVGMEDVSSLSISALKALIDRVLAGYPCIIKGPPELLALLGERSVLC